MRSSSSFLATTLFLAGGLSVLGAAAQQAPLPTRATHEQLQTWRFTTAPAPLPEQGLAWSHDTASWRLTTGKLWLEQPVLDGVITGFVFEGDGLFRISVPDPVERR